MDLNRFHALLDHYSHYSDTMSSSLRIAVLVCDTPVQPVLEKYGDYYAIFQGLLKQGFQDLELPEELDVQFSGYHVVENPQFPELHDYDAVLMTGSSELSQQIHGDYNLN